MRVKPVKSKRSKVLVKDIYKNYELICEDRTWFAFNIQTGSVLWDSGYISREEACREIDTIEG